MHNKSHKSFRAPTQLLNKKHEWAKLGLSRAQLSQAEAKFGSFCIKLSINTTNFKLELLRL